MRWTLRPIVAWPGPFTEKRRNAQFKVNFDRALRDLAYELRQLKAENPVLQFAIVDSDFRREDGWPKANARFAHPGVILNFEGKHGAVSMPCDTFVDWVDNIRALGLALESLRAVDRYGVTKRGEQYTGWRALPDQTVMTPQQAAALVGHLVGIEERIIIASADNFQAAYRTAARKLHPDTNAGQERPEWHRLQTANEVLRKHHNL